MWNLNTQNWFAIEQGEYLVYRIVNTITNLSYIGKTVNLARRMCQHRASKNKSNVLGRAIRKYGSENFTVEILEICNYFTIDAAETRWINCFGTLAPYGYNLKPGGEGGRQHIDSINKVKETKRRLFSDAEYKKRVLANTIARSRIPILCVTTGEYFESQEAAATKFRVSRASICNYVSGKTSNIEGFIFVDALKFKTVEEAIISEDYLEKVKKFNTPKLHPAQRRTIHLPSLIIYPSVLQASKHTVIPSHTLEWCLANNKATTFGHAFAYVNENETALEFAKSEQCNKLLKSIVEKDLRIFVDGKIYESCEHACRSLSIPPTHFRRCLDANKAYKGTMYTKVKGQDSMKAFEENLRTLDNNQNK